MQQFSIFLISAALGQFSLPAAINLVSNHSRQLAAEIKSPKLATKLAVTSSFVRSENQYVLQTTQSGKVGKTEVGFII